MVATSPSGHGLVSESVRFPVSRRLSTLQMHRTRVRTRSTASFFCLYIHSADVLSPAQPCYLQHGRVFFSASVSYALFPRLTSPEVHPVPCLPILPGGYPTTAKAHAHPGQKERLISIRRFISSRLVFFRGMMSLPAFVVLFSFSFRVELPVQRIQRMMIGVENLSQRGMEGYLMKKVDGLLDPVILCPFVLIERGTYFDKTWKVVERPRRRARGWFISILVYLLPGIDRPTSLLFIHRRPLLFEQKRTH
jgi:hypothetical protein